MCRQSTFTWWGGWGAQNHYHGSDFSGPSAHIKSTIDYLGFSIDPRELDLPKFSPDDLLGTTFPKLDDQCVRAEVIWKIQDNDADNHQKIKFLIQVGKDQ